MNAENAQDIMQLALQSADFYCKDKKPTLKQKNKKQKNRIYFDFTDQEAITIANARLFGRNYTFVNPVIERMEENGHLKYLTISNENDKKEPTFLQITLFPFSGNFKVNDTEYVEEGALRALIAHNMIKKYGERYKISFAGYWVKKQKEGYEKDGDLFGHAVSLERRLTSVGKKPKSATSLILGKFDYSSLQDMTPQEMKNWILDQELY